MKRTKRFLALTGAVLLLLMYMTTLIFSLIDSSAATGLLKASIAATILIPVPLYGYILIARLLKGQGMDEISGRNSDNIGDNSSDKNSHI